MDLNTPFIQHRGTMIVDVELTTRQWLRVRGWVQNLLGVSLIATLLLPGAAQAAPHGLHFSADRVVAVTDIHGAYDEFIRLLAEVEILDAEGHWRGDQAHLVISGDIVDRGPRSRAVLDLLMRLEGEAQAAGGRVHTLLGNHEVMNLTGDLRFVSKEEFAAFAADEEPAAREGAWRRFAEQGGSREEFEMHYPNGFFGHLAAFGPEGAYGRWLLRRPVLVIINRTAFVHGGLPASLSPADAVSLEERYFAPLRAHVSAWHQLVAAGVLNPHKSAEGQNQDLQDHLVSGDLDAQLASNAQTVIGAADVGLSASDSPVWYRGTARCNPVIEVDTTTRILDAIGADRVVIGHTPTRGGRARSRMDGRIILLDTGMLAAVYGGVPAALVIAADETHVRYAGDTSVQTPRPEIRRVGTRPGDMSVDQLERLLRESTIVRREKIADPAGNYEVVTLRQGDVTLRARFNRKDTSRGRAKRRARSDSYLHDLAAYQLDRLLDLRLIPATVLRRLGGEEGSLQFVPDGAIDERRRSTDGLGGVAACNLSDQLDLVYAFDALIFNEDRRSSTLWYDTQDWRPLLVDHSRSFRNKDGVPNYLRGRELTIGAELKRRLAGLDEAQLRGSLGRWLADDQIAALLRRRDQLLN